MTTVHTRSSRINKRMISIDLTVYSEFTDEANKQANKILLNYIKKARLSLRVLGGSSESPLFSMQELARQNSRMHRWLGLEYSVVGRPKENISDLEIVKQIILKERIDKDSLAHVFSFIAWGDKSWKNVSNRFKKTYKPLLILHLQGAKLEVPFS